jgi:hypothetical protein
MATRTGIRISGFPVETTETADALTLESEGTRDLVLSSGSDKVGVNEAEPQQTLHVTKDAAADPQYALNQPLIIEDDNRPGIQLVGSANNIGIIEFGDNAHPNAGSINFDHSTNRIRFGFEDDAEKVYIDSSGNMVIDGDLTVSGTTTTVSTTNTVLEDKLIELGNGITGTPSGDAGVIIERGSSANAAIIWDESRDEFVLGTTSATGASTGDLTVTPGNVSVERIGAGTEQAEAEVHAKRDTASGVQYSTTATVIAEDDARPSIQLAGAANNIGLIQFGDNAAEASGQIYYDHSTDKLRIDAGGNGDRVTVDSSGNVTAEGSVFLKEKADATTDVVAYGQLWVNTATPNELFFTTDAGDDIQLTDGTAAAFVGDITGVTAGTGLSGGGTSGAVTLNVDAAQTQITSVGTIATGTWEGTDVGVAHGGTGVSTLTDGGVLLGSGTGAVTAMAVLTDGQMIVGDGTGDPVAESGATLRTSIGVGTGDSPQFTNLDLSSTGDVLLTLDADSDNSGEGDNPAILFKQDGGANKSVIGMAQVGYDPLGVAMTNGSDNALTIAGLITGIPIQFGIRKTGEAIATAVVKIDGSTGELIVGSSGATGVISSAGTHDLKLQTNAGTNSGTIVITDGANGDITITPNGSGILETTGQFVCEGLATTYREVTSNYTVGVNDYLIIASGSGTTVSLPAPSAGNGGTIYKIKRVDASNSITIGRASGSATIDGAATYTLDANYMMVEVMSDETNWLITGAYEVPA